MFQQIITLKVSALILVLFSVAGTSSFITYSVVKPACNSDCSSLNVEKRTTLSKRKLFDGELNPTNGVRY